MYSSFTNLLTVNKLVCSDVNILKDAYTYNNSDCSCVSWIDHILCTNSMNSAIGDICVLYEFILSDHKPISVSFCELLTSARCMDEGAGDVAFVRPCWDKLDDLTIFHYATYVDQLLQEVAAPRELLDCLDGGSRCNNCSHQHLITEYYDKVQSCLQDAVAAYIPSRRSSAQTMFNVPGWNDYVRDKHCEARCAYRDWMADGKPRFGYSFYHMQKTRASFKLALRYCRQNEEQLRADICASNLSKKDPVKFWQSVKKISNSKATKYASTINGVSGEKDITEMWKNYFQHLYNSVRCENDASLVKQLLSTATDSINTVCMSEVVNAIRKQKKW